MDDTKRLKRILTKLAQQHAPHLIAGGWQPTDANLRKLARDLADYKVLLIAASIPPRYLSDSSGQVHQWVDAHAQFYFHLTGTLFPSRIRLDAHYADRDDRRPLVVLNGDASAVLAVMAGYIIPYVSGSRYRIAPPEQEIDDLMEIVLDELECSDLSPPAYAELRRGAVERLRTWMKSPLYQHALTDFDRPLFSVPQRPDALPPDTGPLKTPNNPPPAPTVPGYFEQPVPYYEQQPSSPSNANGSSGPETPPELPHLEGAEEDSGQVETPSEELFARRVPLPRTGTGRLRPPVRGLPDHRPSNHQPSDEDTDNAPSKGPVRNPREDRGPRTP
jgi:hypothetical protein